MDELHKMLESLPELPPDLAEGFDTLKLAIMHHRLDGWRQISDSEVRLALDVLKDMTLSMRLPGET
jgi:hypothetical protein